MDVTFESRRPPIWRIIALIAAIAGALGVLFAYRSRPSVVAVSPEMGAVNVPARAPLTLSFSASMDIESVENALTISPSANGTTTWDANTLTFTPSDAWPRGETIRITLTDDARSRFFLPLENPLSTEFTVAPTLLGYLFPAVGTANLFALDPATGNTAQLTDLPGGVLDITLNADQRSLLYTTVGKSGGEIWRYDLASRQATWIITCQDSLCLEPQLSPDGTMVAYLHTQGAGEDSPNQVRVLELKDDRPAREYTPGPDTTRSQLPRWSDANILCYYDVDRRAYIFYDPAEGDIKEVPNETGELGTWTPTGLDFIFPEIADVPEGLPTSRLLRFNYTSGLIEPLPHPAQAEDATPVFSPSGAEIAFGRKYLDAARWTPGRQLWVMGANGDDAQALTDSPFYNHTAFAWHPNGAQIAYQRASQTDVSEPPEIWLIDANGENAVRLLIGGYNPVWLP